MSVLVQHCITSLCPRVPSQSALAPGALSQSALVRHLESSQCDSTSNQSLAHARTTCVAVVSHLFFSLRLLGQPKCALSHSCYTPFCTNFSRPLSRTISPPSRASQMRPLDSLIPKRFRSRVILHASSRRFVPCHGYKCMSMSFTSSFVMRVP